MLQIQQMLFVIGVLTVYAGSNAFPSSNNITCQEDVTPIIGLQSYTIHQASHPSMYYDSVAEEISYFRNRKIKQKTTTYMYGQPYYTTKIVDERFRKNGNKVSVVITTEGNVTYSAKYDRKGNLFTERTFVYNHRGLLVRMDLRIRGGQTRSTSYPDPELIVDVPQEQ